MSKQNIYSFAMFFFNIETEKQWQCVMIVVQDRQIICRNCLLACCFHNLHRLFPKTYGIIFADVSRFGGRL